MSNFFYQKILFVCKTGVWDKWLTPDVSLKVFMIYDLVSRILNALLEVGRILNLLLEAK